MRIGKRQISTFSDDWKVKRLRWTIKFDVFDVSTSALKFAHFIGFFLLFRTHRPRIGTFQLFSRVTLRRIQILRPVSRQTFIGFVCGKGKSVLAMPWRQSGYHNDPSEICSLRIVYIFLPSCRDFIFPAFKITS